MRYTRAPMGERAAVTTLKRRPWRRAALSLAALLVVVAAVGYLAYRNRYALMALLKRPPNPAIVQWFNDPARRAELKSAFDAPCPGYPFLVPSDGFIGGLPWNAPYGPYTILNPHPGIDIFGGGAPGTVPVRAAYDGWLTREADWVSTVIIRHNDPLHPGETIWTYYTHMANGDGSQDFIDPAFPPGVVEVPVAQGQVIGYQGVYNGDRVAGYGDDNLHLHFSIVKSDAEGRYLNEAIFSNTLDPTPYLGLRLNEADSPQWPMRCLPPPGS